MKDYQLNLVNAINNYNANMNDENDAILVLCVNSESQTSTINIEGNMQLLCETINYPDSILKHRQGNPEIKSGVDMIINVVLSLSANILLNNPIIKKEFLKQLELIEKERSKFMKKVKKGEI